MAQAFYDSFDRSDGPVGANWVVETGAYVIDTNALKATSSGIIRPATPPTSADSTQRVVVDQPITFPKTVTLYFRRSGDGDDAVLFTIQMASTSITVTIQERSGGINTSVGSRTLPYSYAGYVDITAAVVDSQAIIWIDLYQWLAVRHLTITAGGNNALTLPASSCNAEDYWSYDYTTGGFSITVDSGPDENGAYTLSLTNGGKPWTTGTPGSPTFTAISGTIESQEVTDEDTATVVWSPPSITAEDAIVDPLNDFDFSFSIGIPPEAAGPGGEGAGLTPTQSETLDDLALYLGDYGDGGGSVSGLWVKLGAISILAGSAYTTGDGTAIGDLFDAVLDTTNGLAANKNVTDLIYALLDSTTQQGGYSLSSVQEAIRGTSSRDLTAVYNLIDALEVADPTDVTSILNAIAAIRTANMWSLDSVKTWIEAIETGSNQDVLNELALIRTANNWSLGHVMDAIAAVTGTDWTTRFNSLDQAFLNLDQTLDGRFDVIDEAVNDHDINLNDTRTAILAAIGAIPTNPITDLSSVITAISTLSGHLDDKIALVLDAIAAIVPGTGTPTEPVWPGLSGVTLGTPVNLGLTFASDQPCDGVIVHITADPGNHGLYDWGAIVQHPRAGYVSFVTDNGEYSDVQPFSFPNEVVTVKQMLHADGFIGRGRVGLTGTVTPWTISSP